MRPATAAFVLMALALCLVAASAQEDKAPGKGCGKGCDCPNKISCTKNPKKKCCWAAVGDVSGACSAMETDTCKTKLKAEPPITPPAACGRTCNCPNKNSCERSKGRNGKPCTWDPDCVEGCMSTS